MTEISPVTLPHIRNITISGRIGSGQTTLANRLSQILGWEFLEGGAIFEQFDKERKASEIEVDTRPDDIDLGYEEKVKNILTTLTHRIIQSHLAGFDAQGIDGVFKVLVVCEDTEGHDKTDVRIDRLVNRKEITIEEAKNEVKQREEGNLKKWRRLYANNDEQWIYWDKGYYDLIVNTYAYNKEQSVEIVLKAIGYI